MPYLLPWRAAVGVSTMRWSIRGLHHSEQIALSRGTGPRRISIRLAGGGGWSRLDRSRRAAHIDPVTRTTNHAGCRRISLPSPERARAVLIPDHSAEDLSDVVRIAGCRTRR